MKSFKTNILILFTSLFIVMAGAVNVFAQDKIWTGAVDSSWHVAGNWNPSGVPGPSQTVSLRANTTPYPVITSNVTVRSVTINQWYSNPGDELTIRNNATVTITDDFTLSGAGILHIVNGHLKMTATTGGQNNLNLNSAQSVINITNGSFTVGTSSEDVSAEIIGTINVGSGIFTVFGDFDVSNSDTFNAENGSVVINGNSIINGTYNGNDGTTTFNGGVDVRSGGILNLDSGTITFNGQTFVGNNGTVNLGDGNVFINDNLEVKSSGFFNAEDATVTVTGDANFTSNGNLTIDNGTINITGNANLSSGGSFNLNSGNLNVGGGASFTSGGTVNAGNSNINLQGDFTVQNGSNFAADSSTVTFSGDSTQTVNSNGDVTFYNVVVDSGAVLNTDGGSDNTIIIENNLVVEDGGGVDVNGDDKIDVQGDIQGDEDAIASPNPFVVSAIAPNLTSVVITFNKAMKEAQAETIGNYSIRRVSNSASVSISNAVLNTGGNSKQVTLTISTIVENVEYEITINNLQSTDNGTISTNHKKRFKKANLIFYSRQSGNWSTNSTWSTTGHGGSAATSNPGNTNNATVIVGDGDVVTIASSTSIVNQTSVQVNVSSTLRVGSGGVLTTGTKSITGSGTFQVTIGTLKIGSDSGISASGSTGNIQTSTRSFGASGSYTYNGVSAQITGSGLPLNVNDLTIDNASGVTINADVEVTGTLSLTSGTFIIESGNNLIANTKSISSGQLRIKQTISGSNGWRLFSSPLASDFNDFFDAIETQGYSGSSLGNTPQDSLQPNVLYYLESYSGTDNQRWRAPSSASASIPKGVGLYTYVFGDIAADSRYNTALPVDLTVDGQEHSGSVNFGVTYTPAADSGWNLIGNPYAATIDWDDAGNWTKTNVDNTIYIWDYTTNQYKTWNGTTGDLGAGLISPFQGFWVKVNAASPSLIVEENAKKNGGTFVGKRTNSPKNSVAKFSISISDDDNKTSTHFMFSENARLNKDQSDAYRLVPPPGIPSYLDFSSITEDGTRFSINNLPRHFGIPIEIPLFVDVYEKGYSVDKELHFLFENIENIPQGWSVYLVDTKAGSETNILDESTYLFSFKGTQGKRSPNKELGSKPKITTKASGTDSRFLLRIEPGSDANDLPKKFQLQQNYPNPFNPTTNIQFNLPIQSVASVTIYDILGREVTTLVNGELPAGTHTFTWDASRYSSGIYIYRLITNNKVVSKKMTLIK
ncbi:MAG: T9SS type A sorting domain-containing protein [Gracilimonas sp.]|uniref:T9SS type A sorting domain-containing protein n=1 Tax=Gracilimonas sp. TaxID=1974203 RepID=UPI0037507A3E|nr:T9SS type A sorting domain-containing protein [Gracilimonas sp.]